MHFLYSNSQLKKNIILYGAGDIAFEFFKIFRRFEDIIIVDDYNYGKTFNVNGFKFKIRNPKIIKKLINHQVIITTRYLDSIKARIQKIDFLIFFIDYKKKNFIKSSNKKFIEIKLIRKYLKNNSLKLFDIIIDIKNRKKTIKTLHKYLSKNSFGPQYQSFCPKNISTFIDVGFYNGLTSFDMLKKYKSIKKIIAIDPFNLQKNQFLTYIKSQTKFRFIKFAASKVKKIGKIYIDPNPTNNSVKFKTNNYKLINFDKLDNKIKVLDENSFIKFDIEGAELDALKGMSEIIKNYKPNLAVSIYHGSNDFFEIPHYLIKNYSNIYKFEIRHYSFGHNETVLYAIVK
jgi:FkbM family methyltransferase